jgi:hypothetical protein
MSSAAPSVPDRTVRLSQTLSPFGVGAIYDVLGESFVAADIGRWRKHNARLLSAPRLAAALGVKELREAPARSQSFDARPSAGVPYARFPRWLFCGSCRKMVHWLARFEVPGEAARCASCASRRPLIPMRFVVVCRVGHLDDVPWGIWAHSRAEDPNQKQCQRHDLRFLTRSRAGGGLGSLVVRCDTCKAERTLAGITAPGSLAQLNLTCRGIQPWQSPRPEMAHPETAEVVQRGASNVYFAHVRSAIDIPPESKFNEDDELAHEIMASAEFEVVVGSPQGPVAAHLIQALAQSHDVAASEIEALVRAEVQRREGMPSPLGAEDIEGAEWLAFLTPHTEADDRDRFITKHVDLPVAGDDGDPRLALFDPVDRVVQAIRLREVRALTGFSRIAPSGPIVPPDLGRGLDWLPALEVYGEGIFVAFDEKTVEEWEGGPAADRVRVLAARRDSSFQREWLPDVSARFVMLHTLAHLLIRQLAFDSGYASASLTERIYARQPTEAAAGAAGILIYTAAGDQEGTLGGLVRQGEPQRLMSMMLALLTRAAWCSSDPICRESAGQGVSALNLAACHACALLAETSCGYSNALLDRALVVGSRDRGVSFYEGQFNTVMERVAAETLS